MSSIYICCLLSFWSQSVVLSLPSHLQVVKFFQFCFHSTNFFPPISIDLFIVLADNFSIVTVHFSSFNHLSLNYFRITSGLIMQLFFYCRRVTRYFFCCSLIVSRDCNQIFISKLKRHFHSLLENLIDLKTNEVQFSIYFM